ncbi:MAG TPA: DegT/DnrJ/EryC1/StrS family aminotransferase [Verrucomicrobiota bacterium]|nr:DegT/DnrJ/EryC1/StrS family aminotransferase [Verrucomicrobiota bacterium]HQL76896.1 DegT/DnrJ/EryC1/StrS family aminotransferase [Verrucomicrobiota bacterium]
MKDDISRREFIKRGSVAGGTAVLAAGTAGSLLAQAAGADASTPAALGGAKAHAKKWPAWPAWDPADDGKVTQVLHGSTWHRGRLVKEFEEKWAALMGSKHCLAVVNGTNALSASFMVMDLNPGDEVICAPYTFSASMLGVLYKSAMPVWADIDPLTYQMDPAKVEAKITPRTKAILPVHICGYASDMPRLMEIARKHNLKVVEDVCQAHMGNINGRNLGTFGTTGCFSFQTSKVMPIGEGGAIITDDSELYDKLYSYHNYGYKTNITPGSYDNIAAFRLGNKIRMAEYQAAIGLCQLPKLEEQTRIRTENAAYLTPKLAAIPGITPVKTYPGVTRLSYYMYPFIYDAAKFDGLSRADFVRSLSAEGIPASPGYPKYPIYTQEFIHEMFKTEIYRKFYTSEQLDWEAYKQRNHCPGLMKTFDTSVWLSTTGMLLGSKADMDDVVRAIEKIQKHASKLKKA